jgi:hypothetical protein
MTPKSIPSSPVGLLLLPLIAACATTPRQTALMRGSGQISATTAELRTRMAEFGRRFAGGIEHAADDISAATDDPAIRRNAILFKLSAVSAAHDAALRPDPVLAVLDTYAFGVQLEQFFTSDAGLETFGEHAAVGQAALDQVGESWDALLAAVSDSGISAASIDSIERWALRYPLGGVPFVRASLVGETAGLLRSDETGLLTTVSSLEGSVARLEHRVGYLNETAGKQVTWLATLALMDARISDEASAVRHFLDTSSDFIASIPELTDAQREAVVAALREERRAVLLDVDRQRVATLAEINRALATVLETVGGERSALADLVTAERTAAFEELHALVDSGVAGQLSVIDHLFLRLAQLFGALVIILLVGVAVFRFWPKPA